MSVHHPTRGVHAALLRRLAVLAALVAALALAACGGDSSSDSASTGTATTKASVQPPGNLVNGDAITFGTDFTFPPYEAIVGGKQEGFDVDFGKLLAAQMGLQAKFVDNRFASLIPALQSHKFDVILSAMYITPERLKQVDFVPYFNTGNVMVVKASGDYKPTKLEDLCGKIFSINEGAYVEGVVRDQISPRCEQDGKGKITIKSFPTDTASFSEVAAGRSDVTFGDAAVTVARIKDTPALGLEVSSADGELFYPTPGGIAIRKGEADMQRAISEAVQKLEDEGKLDALRKQYGLAPPDAKQVEKAHQEAGA